MWPKRSRLAIRLACRTIFEDWTAKVANRLRAAGWGNEAARDDAVAVVALIEGALLLPRARRDVDPVEAVARHVRATLRKPRT
jgi:TetR/AcrR family transcriptional repressor of lmrAB and yxaGH operons